MPLTDPSLNIGQSFLNISPKTKPLLSGLYPVATPIGNLRDITLRALDVLNMADVIICEDTRITKRLLNAYDITTQLMVYHEHNAKHIRPKLIKRLLDGEKIALVSDAGTPLISDPGYKLIREAAEVGINIFPIPGASAPIAALVKSGIASDRFLFAGFPPVKAIQKRNWFENLNSIDSTLILFESPKRLSATIKLLAELWPMREAAVIREITKKFEEIKRDKLANLWQYYADAGNPKGEIVIVIESPIHDAAMVKNDSENLLVKALKNMTMRDAVINVAAATGMSKKILYNMALEIISNNKTDNDIIDE